jgi:hypothetical protein
MLAMRRKILSCFNNHSISAGALLKENNMNTIFLTTASARSMAHVRLLIDGLRTFGGALSEAPFWVFSPDPGSVGQLESVATRILPLITQQSVSSFLFGWKVAACAYAEQNAPVGTQSLVWIDAACLITQPPTEMILGADYDAAFRPVHIQNVGLPPSKPLDQFWSGIYRAVGVEDVSSTVMSFVDGQLLRTYFNSHSFSVRPSLGLMNRWFRIFQELVDDAAFQSEACSDELHQVFLFQAILSALVATKLDPARVRILPPSYNYPFNLQDRIPPERRLLALNSAVSFTYEESNIHPSEVTGIEIHEPLRSWLEARVTQ